MERYILAFLLSLAISYLVTPLVRWVALRCGVVDKPGERSAHTEPKPHLGGIAIFLAFTAAVLWAVGAGTPAMQGLLLGGTLIMVVGLVDDLFGLSPRLKLLGQVAAAMVLVLFGVQVEFLTNPFGGLIWLGWWSIPFTLLWVVAVTNVMNLIDGLDGLAAGIASIAALTLLVVAVQDKQAVTILLTVALTGATLGFLPHNFNPAKIFMGDTGSLFLGYALAAVSVQGTLKSATAIALVVPILALGLPIFDTFFAIVRRLLNGQPISQADRGHLHHRLLALGLSQRQTVLVMYLVSAWLGLSAIIITHFAAWTGLLFSGGALLLVVLGARRYGVLGPGPGKVFRFHNHKQINQ